jgi:uncharacterized protein YjbJ (UPF0337 family)
MAYIKSWQQFKGISDQLQEALKKRGGKLTDEDLLRIKIQDESVGAIQKRYGHLNGAVSQWTDRRISLVRRAFLR